MKLYLKYIRFILNRPYLLMLGTALALIAGWPALNVKVNNNLEDWFPENSPLLNDKKQFVKDFGNDEMMFLLLTFPDSASDIYRKSMLVDLTDDLSGIYGLEQVFMRYQLQSDQPTFGTDIKRRLKKLENLFFPSLDPNCEMVYMKARLMNNFDLYRPALVDSVNNIITKIPSSIRTDLTGSGVIFNEIDRKSNEEPAMLFVICFIVIMIILAWRIKNIKRLGVALLLFLLLFWPAWSMFGWLGFSVNMVSMIVPILLVINFFAYILHLLNKTIEGEEKYLKTKLPPIVFSGITTMIGFGSLMLSDMKVIYEFGLLTFAGILVGLIVLLLIGVPIVLKLLDNKNTQKTKQPASANSGLKEINILKTLETITPKIASLISLLAIVVILAGVLFFNKIKIDTNSLHYLPSENPIRLASNYIESHFGAFNTVDFLISKKDSSQLNSEDFNLIKSISDSLDQLAYVSGTVNYGHWKPLLTWISGEDKAVARQIAANYITDDKKRARLTLRIPMGSANDMRNYLNEMQQVINKEVTNQPLQVREVGYLPIYLEQIELVVSGMLRSLGIALFFITLCMIIMVRDVKLGLLALIPNTFPLGGVALFMAWNGVPLDIATSVIASIIIGLVVDDTLHIIWAYKNGQEDGNGRSFSKMLSPILPPSTTTSLIFSFGFAVLSFSEMRSVHDFGVLISLAIVLGWIGDFVVFPAVLKVFEQRKV